jgi:acetate kinase
MPAQVITSNAVTSNAVTSNVVTLNAGSSSVKFALFECAAIGPRLLASGQVKGLDAAEPSVESRTPDGAAPPRIAPGADGDAHAGAIRAILDGLCGWRGGLRIGAIGHRVVHGGLDYASPVVLDDAVVERLRALAPLAPLHQPHNLAGIDAARAAFPGVPQVACFDTAFHRGHDFAQDAYALPRAYYERGLRRFGFHGLSYEFVARRLREIAPDLAEGRVVVAHLGAGASMCAMRAGRSVATTMGFSALDGLPMGTRCGRVDPGLLLYLLSHDGLTPERLSHLLYEESGLLGLSGLTSDMRALEASSDPRAKDAIDCFVLRARLEIGALAAALGGLDALVFTAGIGENSPRVRAEIVEGLGWLGVRLDPAANRRHAQIVSPPGAPVAALVIPTDEEATIARHAIEAVRLA